MRQTDILPFKTGCGVNRAKYFSAKQFYCYNLTKVASNKQVCYWRCKWKTHKKYNYLQLILKHAVFTNVIKMPGLEGLRWESLWSNKYEGMASALSWGYRIALMKVENVLRDLNRYKIVHY